MVVHGLMNGTVLDASLMEKKHFLWESSALGELSVPGTVHVSETASLTALRQAFGRAT